MPRASEKPFDDAPASWRKVVVVSSMLVKAVGNAALPQEGPGLKARDGQVP